MNLRATLVCCVTVVLLGMFPTPARSDMTVVVPNANVSTPGASNNGFPFNYGDMRYQQVYAGSEFGGLSGLIKQIAFRPDEYTGQAFSTTGIDTEIRFSHTSYAPQGLSATFADNIGPDETLVFDGLLSLSSAGNNSLFDIIIDVDDAFFYDGASNLLMDIKVFNVVRTTQFDSAGTGVGDGGLSSTDRLWAYGAGSLTGSSAGDDGYVTQFTIGPLVPLPGAVLLGALGLSCAGWRLRRRTT